MNLRNLTDKFAGRHTMATGLFSAIGTIMHWFHRLDSTYITFVGVMMGYITAKSIQDDVKEKVNGASSNSVVASTK